MIAKLLSLIFFFSVTSAVEARGISRQRSLYSARSMDSPIDSLPCQKPSFITRLPPLTRKAIDDAWFEYEGGDCWVQLARTRNILMQMSPMERSKIVKPVKECKAPEIINTLPQRAQKRIMQIWKERDPNGNCWEQQRKTRLILLNLPASLRSLLHPPAFECAVPHFIDRLEFEIQVQLRKIWDGYKVGQQCAERVDQQLRFLEQNDISLQSFQMPPPTMFRRYDILRKLRRASTA